MTDRSAELACLFLSQQSVLLFVTMRALNSEVEIDSSMMQIRSRIVVELNIYQGSSEQEVFFQLQLSLSLFLELCCGEQHAMRPQMSS